MCCVKLETIVKHKLRKVMFVLVLITWSCYYLPYFNALQIALKTPEIITAMLPEFV